MTIIDNIREDEVRYARLYAQTHAQQQAQTEAQAAHEEAQEQEQQEEAARRTHTATAGSGRPHLVVLHGKEDGAA